MFSNASGSHFGNCRLYSDMHTVSCCLMNPSKLHFMYPFVPRGSRM
jgi:hypothetical protein